MSTINIGDRQKGRVRADHTYDCNVNCKKIISLIERILSKKKKTGNIFSLPVSAFPLCPISDCTTQYCPPGLSSSWSWLQTHHSEPESELQQRFFKDFGRGEGSVEVEVFSCRTTLNLQL